MEKSVFIILQQKPRDLYANTEEKCRFLTEKQTVTYIF